MKNLTLTLPLIFFSLLASAQVEVEGVNINELDITYCQIIGTDKALLGRNVIINVDYGQKFKPFGSQLIKGKDGNAREFNSIVGALNFMNDNGWEYVNNYAVSSQNGSVYHYLLKKRQLPTNE